MYLLVYEYSIGTGGKCGRTANRQQLIGMHINCISMRRYLESSVDGHRDR